jgi:hypothetical protein
MNELLEKLSKDFPDHIFEIINGNLFIDTLPIGYCFTRIEDLPIYTKEFDTFESFRGKEALREALRNDLCDRIETELQKREETK